MVMVLMVLLMVLLCVWVLLMVLLCVVLPRCPVGVRLTLIEVSTNTLAELLFATLPGSVIVGPAIAPEGSSVSVLRGWVHEWLGLRSG